MYDEQSASFMAQAAEWSDYYHMACNYAGRIQNRHHARFNFDLGLALYGVAYYINIRRGEFFLYDPRYCSAEQIARRYDTRSGAYHYGLHFGRMYFAAYINLMGDIV